MKTLSNENIFRVTGPCVGNSPVTGEFPTQRPVTRSFDVFIDLCLNKLLSKQPWGWWLETPSRSLWHHCKRHWDNRLIASVPNHNKTQQSVNHEQMSWRESYTLTGLGSLSIFCPRSCEGGLNQRENTLHICVCKTRLSLARIWPLWTKMDHSRQQAAKSNHM